MVPPGQPLVRLLDEMEIPAHRLVQVVEKIGIFISPRGVFLPLHHEGQLDEGVVVAIRRPVEPRYDFEDVGPADTFPHSLQSLLLYRVVKTLEIPHVTGDHH